MQRESTLVTKGDWTLCQEQLTRWLTLEQRPSLGGVPGSTQMAHRIAYDTALLEEFLAALPQRIAFWEHVRAKKTWSKLEHVPTIWDSQLDAYIERLRWVEEHSREATAHLNGHFRFHVVAVALKFGINSAIRYADGPARHFTEAITDDVLSADMELELLIYQQRSDTFQFKASPPLDTAQACESLTASK